MRGHDQRQGRRVAAGLSVSAVLLVGALGCQNLTSAPADDQTSVTSALTQTFQVSLSLPAFAHAADTVIAADGQIDVGDRVTIVRAPGLPGIITNTGALGSTIGSRANSGSVYSLSQVTVRDSGTVNGDVLTTVPVVLQNQARVTGQINQHAVFLPKKLVSWTVNYPATSLGNVTVNGGQSLSRAPGRYSDVNVKTSGTLTLSSGTYYVDGLTLEPGSSVKLNQAQGPVIIYSRTAIIFRGAVSAVGGGVPQVLIVYLGTSTNFIEAAFTGTWMAPTAKLVLAASGSTHQGTFMARDVQVYPDVTVKQIRLTGDFDKDGLSTADEIDTYGSNPFVADTDGDGMADGAEVAYWSSRTDGISWNSDVDVIAARQNKDKGDGLINLLDPDSDNDGILDGAEVQGWDMLPPSGPAVHVTSDPAVADTDGDGLSDSAERAGARITVNGVARQVFSHPRVVDTDGDGLSDFAEVRTVFSDPQNTHTFGPFYKDPDRARNLASAGPSVLDPPCKLYADGQPENVFTTFYTLQPQITTPTFDARSVRQLYVPDNRPGVAFTVHFRSELANDPNTLDQDDTFSDVQLKRPDATAFESLSPGPNPGEYVAHITPTTPQTFGFYEFQLIYHFDNDLSRYHVFATFDDNGQTVPLAWTDPDLSAHVQLAFQTDGTAPVFLRGGAYGDGTDAAQSFITNITLDGQKLYERSFNGADINFPLGALALGTYTLDFDFVTSTTSTFKLMTHICQFGVPWGDVQINYMADAHTRILVVEDRRRRRREQYDE